MVSIKFKYQDYDLIIFDFDGVIIDSNKIKKKLFFDLFQQYLTPKLKIEINNFLFNYAHLNRKEKISFIANKLLLNPKKKEIDSLINQFSRLSLLKLKQANLIPGIEELLNKIKENNICISINSAANKDEILKVLKYKNLLSFFDNVFGNSYSKSANMKKILSLYKDINPKKICFIGDHISDHQAANEFQINFIGINHKNFKEYNFKNFKIYENFLSMI
jgi:beta-phosphoglucomutase-like phosphatase (HAD superfamily)